MVEGLNKSSPNFKQYIVVKNPYEKPELVDPKKTSGTTSGGKPGTIYQPVSAQVGRHEFAGHFIATLEFEKLPNNLYNVTMDRIGEEVAKTLGPDFQYCKNGTILSGDEKSPGYKIIKDPQTGATSLQFTLVRNASIQTIGPQHDLKALAQKLVSKALKLTPAK